MTLDVGQPALLAFSDDEAAEALPVRGSSFYLGLRILPREQRLAMYAIYSFCRAVDDVADGTEPGERRLERLRSWRRTVDGLYSDRQPPASLEALHGAIRRFGLGHADFSAIIDGMATDAAADGQAPGWDALDLYCDRVASAPGRLSVRVFGLDAEAGPALAHHLGRALQLTNILRDVDEDAAMGRLYLPREALDEAGIAALPAAELLRDARLTTACRVVAARAVEHFRQAERIMDGAPRPCVRAPRLMAAAYRPLLGRLLARGWAPPRRKMSKSKLILAGAVLRYGLF